MDEIYVMNLPLKFVNHRIEEYAMQVTYDPREGAGDVIYNLSLVKTGDLEYVISTFKDAFRAGVCVSGLVRIGRPGEIIENFRVPDDHCAVITMCSSTLDGVLMRRGVPLNPIGGGVVEVDQRIPRRFTHIILYEYTTIDPLQVLISQEMTSVASVMRKGYGNLLANIRQCHMEAESLIGEVIDDFAESCFSGILDVGLPNTPALGVAVDPQYIGIVALGGTNPMAAVRESGRYVMTQAIKGVMNIAEMSDILDY